jgi:hypothetical protein
VPLSAGLCCFSLPSSPFWHVTHIGPATVHACVRITRSNQNRYNSKTPQVRLRFMFHYQPLPNRRLINGAPPDTPAPQPPDRLRRKSTTKDDSPPPPQPDTPIRLYSLLFVLFVVHRKLPRFCTIPFATDPVACATLSGVECHLNPHAQHGALPFGRHGGQRKPTDASKPPRRDGLRLFGQAKDERYGLAAIPARYHR